MAALLTLDSARNRARKASPSRAAAAPKGGRRAGPAPKAVAARKADAVADHLLRKIASGAIAVGSLLPKEAELASEHGVNRGVIREAVKLLEVHRLVRPVRRRGTEVLDPLHSMSPEVLVALLVPRPGHVDRRALEAFLEVRALLDVEMTVLAAERRTQADLRALRACLAELEAQLGNPVGFAAQIARVPLLVARATKNPVFEMMAAFNGRVVAELEASMVATRPASREQVEGLGILVDVIEHKDADGARRIVTTFHAWSTPRILASAALASGAPLSQLLERSR